MKTAMYYLMKPVYGTFAIIRDLSAFCLGLVAATCFGMAVCVMAAAIDMNVISDIGILLFIALGFCLSLAIGELAAKCVGGSLFDTIADSYRKAKTFLSETLP